MKYLNCPVISDATTTITNGSQIDANQLLAASFQATFSNSGAAGTLKLQMSNDTSPTNYSALGNFTVTNWTDIASATATVVAGASVLISLPQGTYPPSRWLRAVYTSTAVGVQTIVLGPDVSGSLNNTYFLIGDASNVHKYYVWFNINSAGTDPLIAGRTAVPITGATNASAATLGAAVASAIAALNSTNSFTTSGTSTVTVTDKIAGPIAAAVDGVAPTGFTFAVTSTGTANITTNMFAISV